MKTFPASTLSTWAAMIVICLGMRTTSASPVHSGRPECQEPEDNDLFTMYAQMVANDETESLTQVDPLYTALDESPRGYTLPPSDERELPNVSQILRPESLCPWREQLTVSPSRFPRVIPTAKLSTRHWDPRYRCETIEHYMRVLRRKQGSCSAHGRYEYEPSWQKVTIAWIPVSD